MRRAVAYSGILRSPPYNATLGRKATSGPKTAVGRSETFRHNTALSPIYKERRWPTALIKPNSTTMSVEE